MPSWSTRCGRCGEDWDPPHIRRNCVHPFTCRVIDMSDQEAERVKARYALGKRTNPDHDETSYRDKYYDHASND